MSDTVIDEPIVVYFWPTPNGLKVSIMLEELGAPYRVHYVDIGKGEQFAPEFLKISPNNRIPAIFDPEGPDGQPLTVFESGAILRYLARKWGMLYGDTERAATLVDEWLFWQVGGLGPMAGQNFHFTRYAPTPIDYAIERYRKETKRLFKVMDTRLSEAPYLAGAYSIADIACFTWALRWRDLDITLEDVPAVADWMDRISQRPAVQRGLAVGADPAQRINAVATLTP